MIWEGVSGFDLSITWCADTQFVNWCNFNAESLSGFGYAVMIGRGAIRRKAENLTCWITDDRGGKRSYCILAGSSAKMFFFSHSWGRHRCWYLGYWEFEIFVFTIIDYFILLMHSSKILQGSRGYLKGSMHGSMGGSLKLFVNGIPWNFPLEVQWNMQHVS